ncbi:MAG: ArsC/Spx/MgsR family protein, partial [Pseudomonadota bacterium]
SKSRAALQILEGAKTEFEVFNYLSRPPSIDQIKGVLRKLGISAIELVRTSEPEWRITGLQASSSESAIQRALAAYPILIQRPILETETRAVIGRPPERVRELL